MNIRKKEYFRFAYAINNYDKPITRNKAVQIARILHFSGMSFGYLPDDLINKIYKGNIDDTLTARVENAINWAVKDGELQEDLQNPDLILPKNFDQKLLTYN